jgi:hypothetical protein
MINVGMSRALRYLRILRVAFSAVCGIACVLFLVLWLRSYTRRDEIAVPVNAAGLIQIQSHPGKLVPSLLLNAGSDTLLQDDELWLIRSQPLENRPRPGLNTIVPGIEGVSRPDFYQAVLPYWFLILVSLAIGVFFWLPWRVSLSVIVLIGLALGLIIATTR